MMISLQLLLERHQLMNMRCTNTAISPDALHDPGILTIVHQLTCSNSTDQENASAGSFDR